MSKTTNKNQQKIMLSHMNSRPDIARGFHKGNKEEVARFWRNAEAELNSAGPPIKNITEWKKVWTDQKKYVRQKAAQNLKHSKGTGGGPNATQPFSAHEEAIYNLIPMEESVEGVTAETFGLPSVDVTEVIEVTAEPIEEGAFSAEYFEVLEAEKDIRPAIPATPTSLPTKRAAKPATKKVGAKTTTEVVEAELEVQQAILEKIKQAVSLMAKRNDVEARHFEEMEALKREANAEMRRHNALLEEMLKLKL